MLSKTKITINFESKSQLSAAAILPDMVVKDQDNYKF